MEYLVVTAQTPQHINIWSKITQIINDTGCHICQGQGQRLAGEDALTLLISGNWNTIAKLETSLKCLSKQEKILLNIKRSKPLEDQIQLLPYFVEVFGLDEPRVLFHIIKFFSSEQISIENIQLENYISSATSAPMFSLKVSTGIPSTINIGELRERFILFCEDLNIDGAIEPDKR